MSKRKSDGDKNSWPQWARKFVDENPIAEGIISSLSVWITEGKRFREWKDENGGLAKAVKFLANSQIGLMVGASGISGILRKFWVPENIIKEVQTVFERMREKEEAKAQPGRASDLEHLERQLDIRIGAITESIDRIAVMSRINCLPPDRRDNGIRRLSAMAVAQLLDLAQNDALWQSFIENLPRSESDDKEVALNKKFSDMGQDGHILRMWLDRLHSSRRRKVVEKLCSRTIDQLYLLMDEAARQQFLDDMRDPIIDPQTIRDLYAAWNELAWARALLGTVGESFSDWFEATGAKAGRKLGDAAQAIKDRVDGAAKAHLDASARARAWAEKFRQNS